VDIAAVKKAEEFFLANLGHIDRIAGFICRRNHLSSADAEDFVAHVRVKLIENDYAVLRKFEGRSSLPSYLTTVIHRFFLQQRVEMWGKWRPSAEARRLGDKAITLERLLTRDGFSFREAVALLMTGARPEYTIAELEAIYARLPSRAPRPVLVSDAAAEAVADNRGGDVDIEDRMQTLRSTARALDDAIGKLDPEEQICLRMRFWSNRRIGDIAEALGIDSRKMYKRFDRMLSSLREALVRAGVDRQDIEAMIECGDADVQLDLVREKSNSRHSQLEANVGSEKPPVTAR